LKTYEPFYAEAGESKRWKIRGSLPVVKINADGCGDVSRKREA
jgi:hypothetical protein